MGRSPLSKDGTYTGPLPKKCVATSKHNGNPCKNPPIEGGTVCRMHGGGAPQVKAAAARRLGEASADKEFQQKYFIRRREVTNPLDALQEIAGDTLAIKDVIQARVAELTSIRYQSAEGSEQIRGELQVYMGLLKDAHRALNDICKLALDEKRVQIQAAQVRVINGAVLAGLKDAGFKPDEITRARNAIANRLRQPDYKNRVEITRGS
jgi:hypothetical protein